MAFSSGEAEDYALVKAGSVSLEVSALMQELGICLDRPIEVNSDASAAIGISNQVGSGKVRHTCHTRAAMVSREGEQWCNQGTQDRY